MLESTSADASAMEQSVVKVAASSRTTVTVFMSASGNIRWANAGFQSILGRPVDEVLGTMVWTLLPRPDSERLRRVIEEGDASTHMLLNMLGAEGHPLSLDATVEVDAGGVALMGSRRARDSQNLSEHLQALNNELAVLAREHARGEREQRSTAEELQRVVDELHESYRHLKRIQEVIPICMRCSRVKPGDSEWQQVAEYLREHQIFLSHGYCPACADVVLDESKVR
jgi:PAS domain-containing protein